MNWKYCFRNRKAPYCDGSAGFMIMMQRKLFTSYYSESAFSHQMWKSWKKKLCAEDDNQPLHNVSKAEIDRWRSSGNLSCPNENR